MDEVTWTIVAGVLTALGALWTVYAFRNRGAVSGLRGAAFTMLPVAAWATGSLEMFARISTSVVDFVAGFVLSPLAWVGISLLGVSVLLFGTAGVMSARGVGGRPVGDRAADDRAATDGTPARRPQRQGRKEALPPASGPQGAPVDEDLDDIEAILRRRGIS